MAEQAERAREAREARRARRVRFGTAVDYEVDMDDEDLSDGN